MKSYLPQMEKIKIESEKETLKEFVLLLKYYNYLQDAVYSNVIKDKETLATLNEVLIALHPYLSVLNRWSDPDGTEIFVYKMGNGLADAVFKEEKDLSDLSKMRLDKYNQWFDENLDLAWSILNRGLKLLNEDLDKEEQIQAKEFYDENLKNATLFRVNHRELLTSSFVQLADLKEFWQDWQYINYEVSNLNLDNFDLSDEQRLYLYSMALNIKEDKLAIINKKLSNFEELLEDAVKIQEEFESITQSTDKNEIIEKFMSLDQDIAKEYQESLEILVNTIKNIGEEWLEVIDTYRGFKTLIRAPHLIENEEIKELSPEIFLKEE